MADHMTIVWILLRGAAEIALLWVGFWIGRRWERAYVRSREISSLMEAEYRMGFRDELPSRFATVRTAMLEQYCRNVAKGVPRVATLMKARNRD